MDEILAQHQLRVEQRKKLTLTGVTQVLHFDEEMTRLDSCMGIIRIHGRGLKLKCLSLDGGLVTVEGEICAVIYEEQQEKRRFGKWRD